MSKYLPENSSFDEGNEWKNVMSGDRFVLPVFRPRIFENNNEFISCFR